MSGVKLQARAYTSEWLPFKRLIARQYGFRQRYSWIISYSLEKNQSIFYLDSRIFRNSNVGNLALTIYLHYQAKARCEKIQKLGHTNRKRIDAIGPPIQCIGCNVLRTIDYVLKTNHRGAARLLRAASLNDLTNHYPRHSSAAAEPPSTREVIRGNREDQTFDKNYGTPRKLRWCADHANRSIDHAVNSIVGLRVKQSVGELSGDRAGTRVNELSNSGANRWRAFGNLLTEAMPSNQRACYSDTVDWRSQSPRNDESLGWFSVCSIESYALTRSIDRLASRAIANDPDSSIHRDFLNADTLRASRQPRDLQVERFHSEGGNETQRLVRSASHFPASPRARDWWSSRFNFTDVYRRNDSVPRCSRTISRSSIPFVFLRGDSLIAEPLRRKPIRLACQELYPTTEGSIVWIAIALDSSVSERKLSVVCGNGTRKRG